MLWSREKLIKKVTDHLLIPLQAERLMEALDLYQDETLKLQEHEEQCKVSKKQVG